MYILDGLLYTLTNWPKHLLTLTQSDLSDPSKADSAPSSPTSNPAHLGSTPKRRRLDPKDEHSDTGSRFFKRTESVLVSRDDEATIQMSNDRFFGAEGGASLALENPELVGPPNQWGKPVESFSRPLHEEYPLASRPHLLKPFAKKEVLFGGVGKVPPPVEGGGAGEGRGEGSKEGEGQERAQEEVVHRKEGGKKGRKRKHTGTSDGNRYVKQRCSMHYPLFLPSPLPLPPPLQPDHDVVSRPRPSALALCYWCVCPHLPCRGPGQREGQFPQCPRWLCQPYGKVCCTS